uniref:Uncharacterized protein n=1 Tax=Trichuris muris TaxID=70415 RepID=A0A5S6R466_TRIMR
MFTCISNVLLPQVEDSDMSKWFPGVGALQGQILRPREILLQGTVLLIPVFAPMVSSATKDGAAEYFPQPLVRRAQTEEDLKYDATGHDAPLEDVVSTAGVVENFF